MRRATMGLSLMAVVIALSVFSDIAKAEETKLTMTICQIGKKDKIKKTSGSVEANTSGSMTDPMDISASVELAAPPTKSIRVKVRWEAMCEDGNKSGVETFTFEPGKRPFALGTFLRNQIYPCIVGANFQMKGKGKFGEDNSVRSSLSEEPVDFDCLDLDERCSLSDNCCEGLSCEIARGVFASTRVCT